MQQIYGIVKTIAETDRLILREFDPEQDAEGHYEMSLDTIVQKFTDSDPFESLEATIEFLKSYDRYERTGMGRWTVLLKDTGDFIGWCGLIVLDDGQIDLGYRLIERYRGKGYATEASLKYRFDQLKLERIIAHAMVENDNSINVMKKLNMKCEGNVTCEGHPAVQYSITKKEWESR